MKRFNRWVDFGSTGISPQQLDIVYDPEARYEFSDDVERVVDQLWNEATRELDVLHDGDSLNMLSGSASDRRIRLGPASFRHHYVRLLHLHDEISLGDFGLSADEVQSLVTNVRILSSFTVVSTGSELVLGLRGDDRSRLTFPGSGYLDAQMDVDAGGVKRPQELIARELDEELNLADHISTIDVLGVYEESSVEGDCNPGVISLVQVNETKDRINEHWASAPDAWEFEQLHFLPVEKQPMERLLTRAFDTAHEQSTLLDPPVPDEATVEGKSIVALLLVGRSVFGDTWYQEQLSSLAERLSIDDITAGPDI